MAARYIPENYCNCNMDVEIHVLADVQSLRTDTRIGKQITSLSFLVVRNICNIQCTPSATMLRTLLDRCRERYRKQDIHAVVEYLCP